MIDERSDFLDTLRVAYGSKRNVELRHVSYHEDEYILPHVPRDLNLSSGPDSVI